jgi:hypothetical protein
MEFVQVGKELLEKTAGRSEIWNSETTLPRGDDGRKGMEATTRLPGMETGNKEDGMKDG